MVANVAIAQPSKLPAGGCASAHPMEKDAGLKGDTAAVAIGDAAAQPQGGVKDDALLQDAVEPAATESAEAEDEDDDDIPDGSGEPKAE